LPGRFIGAGREKDEGNDTRILIGLQGGLQREPVHLRHHDVRDDEVRNSVLNLFEGRLPVGGRKYVVVFAQAVLKQFPDCTVVLNN
jgi:hypothetical protein